MHFDNQVDNQMGNKEKYLKEDNYKESWKDWFLIPAIAVPILFIIVIFFTKKPQHEWYDISAAGTVGDALGGITAPFINLLAAILVYVAFKAQVRANKIQFDSLKRDRADAINQKLSQQLTELYKQAGEEFNDLEYSRYGVSVYDIVKAKVLVKNTKTEDLEKNYKDETFFKWRALSQAQSDSDTFNDPNLRYKQGKTTVHFTPFNKIIYYENQDYLNDQIVKLIDTILLYFKLLDNDKLEDKAYHRSRIISFIGTKFRNQIKVRYDKIIEGEKEIRTEGIKKEGVKVDLKANTKIIAFIEKYNSLVAEDS